MKYLKFLAIACLSSLLALYTCISNAGTLSTQYIDPAYLTSVPFGSHSHWIQPWRAYMETVPAQRFVRGIGIVWNVEAAVNPELVAQMLAKYGFKRVRVEIGWGAINFNDETQIVKGHADKLKNILVALKKYNLRPLILLNSHHGVPCPLTSVQLTLSKNASVGDNKIELNSTSNLKVGYSGISNISQYWAAEYLITNINNNTVTLSKPLPKNLTAGTILKIDTLKYRPFSVPGSSDYQNTMIGWHKYVDTVTKFVTDSLGTVSSDNKGFDLEIWNELTFGSKFLYINTYYSNNFYQYQEKDIWTNLVKETATYIDAHSANFTGVKISNGFANTIPWPASSQQPARINAISKHPYRSRENYSQSISSSNSINALGQPDNTFIPNYSTLFPEYFGTAITTETLIRDMGPITSKVIGIDHGRYARGNKLPVNVWITETNILPTWLDPNITRERALTVKAKIIARYFCFYLNKGATQVYLYGVGRKDLEWAVLKESFLDYTLQNTTYPTDDSSHTSLALKTLNNIVTQMKAGLDSNLKTTQQLEVISVSDTHDRYQFKGNGTKAHPNLYDRDVFTFLPFQVNANKFVIPYYVMTRDIQKDLTPENFTVEIRGISNLASVSVYDPINEKTVPVKVSQNTSSNTFNLELIATDYPYLLIINTNNTAD
jgi:hypothetical protein